MHEPAFCYRSRACASLHPLKAAGFDTLRAPSLERRSRRILTISRYLPSQFVRNRQRDLHAFEAISLACPITETYSALGGPPRPQWYLFEQRPAEAAVILALM